MDVDIKPERDDLLPGSPSQSPTLEVVQKSNLTPTPTPPPESALDAESTNGTTSKSSTPPPKQPKKHVPHVLQLISDLPVAREEALKSFNEIPDNNYQYKTLGRSRELMESMTCDCSYEHGIDSERMACGPYSDCINRLTQVECLAGDCRCRNYCQNQRLQRKEYAPIEIVLTEKKGYGLRAEEDLPKDAFIYEYVGDVVNPISFKKRMREYGQEGIRHFYFMMLQKDEFIDATKNGGIGRFANHSCNPNCYVAKWTVGDKVRMGIFAKRTVKKHEELTFNYNVDRYGHQAQTCFCGEANCVGYIGGKTQTEFAGMDDLYLDALGITDEDELLELKGTKKKRGKKIDDPDFLPMLKPVVEKDIPKVVQAIRQTTSRKMLSKILTRIRITEDQAALRQLMRLRGYSIMTNVLNDYKGESDIILLALQCLETWPLMNKNKVEDSQIFLPVEEFAMLGDEKIKKIAQRLLDHWNTLPTYNRIPKRLITVRDEPSKPKTGEEEDEFFRREQEIKRARMEEEQAVYQQLRLRVEAAKQAENEKNSKIVVPTYLSPDEQRRRRLAEQQKIQAIITSVAEAKAAEEMAAALEAEERQAKEELAAAKKKKMTQQEKANKEVNKEKRLLKLVGAVVVKSMGKYVKGLAKEDFKKHAKELTHLIAEKEKKSSSYKENRLDSLSEEKLVKINKYCKDYLVKLMQKLEKSGKLNKHRTSSSSRGHGETPSSLTHTPGSEDGGNKKMDNEDDGVQMTVEEAMDMDVGDDGDDDDDGVDEYDDQPNGHDDHPKSNTLPVATPTPPESSSTASNIANAYAQRRRQNQDYHDNDHDPPDSWGPPRRQYSDRPMSKSGYSNDSTSGWTR
ncbi:hypothetical protein AGABI2DRAFT_76781 [Agaricus bisporus var. bisporus H97]|uniref:hypothetical protein n=1 Tax=Agaricus bisporus var. bisporus (strain H97 / ATCC MYA-4626 / FGSC 10389) TaxID=936046 RepID=UPI00029F6CA9|nr:hypothetical protein AGABI2DRAFT_76781 [Agaricus bisporus var. bisporus H97]EKV43541.1 hypothetical protein AGABI2DRAFT_76781 [Agaricus bisporus var. bisporus H97]